VGCSLSLAVVGDFKRGKSTLINALVGSEVVTTNVTPETVTINYIEHGTENKIEAVLEDGGKVDLQRLSNE
jgi:GTPase SAR1 family protein